MTSASSEKYWHHRDPSASDRNRVAHFFTI
jgi:hypothetical protein